jgi:hypothetical protein
MSDFSRFFKANKAKKENTFYPATKSLLGEDGKPLLWEIRALTTKENDVIQDSCTKEVPIPGKTGMYRHRIDTTAYIAKMLVSSIVSPDLHSAELQDSYGVNKPEDLLKEMVDDPSEYNNLTLFVQNFNGFDVSLQEDIDAAKN